MLSAQVRHDWPSKEGIRSAIGAENQATMAIAQTASTGATKPIQARRTLTPGRARRCTETKAQTATHRGKSSLTQNIGSAITCLRSSRTP
ncbi:hypothetical protein FQZ97_923850 [compost metagenome]